MRNPGILQQVDIAEVVRTGKPNQINDMHPLTILGRHINPFVAPITPVARHNRAGEARRNSPSVAHRLDRTCVESESFAEGLGKPLPEAVDVARQRDQPIIEEVAS
jgi:hypothetical protein